MIVVYPATPFFLYANPDMLKWTLESLYQYQEGGFYPNGYSMHDLGSSFPNATGHVEGNDEYMPVEESGNMILMSYGKFRIPNIQNFIESIFLTIDIHQPTTSFRAMLLGFRVTTRF